MAYIGILVLVILLGYFVIRFYSLKAALRETSEELQSIQKDLTQNQVLHLLLPDKDLEVLLLNMNRTLDNIRQERRLYAEHEREFQSLIEAISHDLRTPLTVILGYLKLLNKQGQGLYTDEQKQMLDITIRKAQAMEKLIAQLYDYSRLNAKDYELVLDKVDVGRILREVFVSNCLILETANLQVDTVFPNQPVWVQGEKDALERVFTNLMQNMGRYAAHAVRISVEKKGKQVHILFENDTTNISQKDVPHLFKRFYTNDASRNQGGTGLGLTIAKGLIQEMGGDLTASMEETDTGCAWLRFTLELMAVDA